MMTTPGSDVQLFPLFLKLRGRPCLVVGAGRIAESKMDNLLRCGARVHVVAPTATDAIREAARAGRIEWRQRAYQVSDLTGVFLVVAATSSPDLHERVYRQARQAGILCNVVDDPARCDFYYPAVVRRGPLQIAISTAGCSPLLAQRLRDELERQFGPEYGPWTEHLGRARSALLTNDDPPEQRRRLLVELSSERAFEEFRARSQNRWREEGKTRGKVFFVGAGPGDPELLTRKAWTTLTTAEVVLHDALVAPGIVRLAPADAVVRDVGKRCGEKSITQEEIHAMLIRYAASARRVVRLQGGDPLIFGRAGEEMEALREAGVEFEIIPGVTAASAAAASAQVALTDRRIASRLVFLSGHRRTGAILPASDLVSAPQATLAIYMPGGNYGKVVPELYAAGFGPETPCLVVSQASTEEQLILRSDLASLAELPVAPPPAILIVGEAVKAETQEPATLVSDAARRA
jgi:uroporphyrin-III C-methyltransferase / precorrin-2 dehydrogenase / sirohydrochlorin ferrochelatase